MNGANNMNYRNPCITMHQPWASLLVYGIKRIEGRSWRAPIRGRLWIHAAGKVPENATIKAMEDFYREIYAVDGITDLKFPEHYPVSRLLGCIEVVGCVGGQELACWKEVPEGIYVYMLIGNTRIPPSCTVTTVLMGLEALTFHESGGGYNTWASPLVRLEALTNFCWLCEQPQILSDPLEMRGFQGVYEMERKIYEAAVRALVPVESSVPVKFPPPNPRDPYSLKPGSISAHLLDSKSSQVEKSSSLSAAIAGARAAATQFSKKDQKVQTNVSVNRNNNYSSRKVGQIRSKSLVEDNTAVHKVGTSVWREKEQIGSSKYEGNRSDHKGFPNEELDQHPRASSKIFVAALRALGPS